MGYCTKKKKQVNGYFYNEKKERIPLLQLRFTPNLLKFKYIKGDTITNFYGRMLYTFDGSSFKEFSGFITFQYNNGRIRRFGSIDEYVIKGDPTKTEIAALILLFIAPK